MDWGRGISPSRIACLFGVSYEVSLTYDTSGLHGSGVGTV
jgi:hypothetical protein